MQNTILTLCLLIASCTTVQNSPNDTRARFIDVVTVCVGGSNSESSYKFIANYDEQVNLGFSTSKSLSYALQGYLSSFNESDRLEAYDKFTDCFKKSKTAY
ncbi:hypothetical protein MNBD_GAMMA22-1665 [hydrothermal vent metagenome]|uniref:Uncharacterized protein n=1 Tax=hydrothermal vent metagenome TaxID=652676 RepID=A0A3B0ZN55_9ZZZZ